MSTRKPPYYHADGSNCWTKDCHRRKAGQSYQNDNLSTDSSKRLNLGSRSPVERSGGEINKVYQLRNTIKGGFKPEKFNSVVNPTGEELSWTKPNGGLWLATVDEAGGDSWNDLHGTDPEDINQQDVTNLKFKDNARVLVIDSLADYKQVLSEASYVPDVQLDDLTRQLFSRIGFSMVTRDGQVARIMDYEKLSTKYDAVLVTWAGLYASGRNISTDVDLGDACSLYMWDIESCFVMNKDSIEPK